ncbi:nitrogen regulation protein NR(II) [Candidatus Deferrimicrobium sp.]|uniref:two-component system sensor histidine kinase NtrB n=1 Tax=Candidatus Deferrimicrobium sp. TaxID=3060586 RepID=UPI00271DF009|nr:ATP-binding protein [Candidatus Deferrimicrobium sp.]MDO8737902.1 ATP-binding protein [Candidatus Deferrimicrobium sp.]
MSDLLRQTLESVNIGILVFDLAGKLAYINPAAEEILQGSSQALAGKHFRTLFRGSPEAVRIVRKAIEENTPVTSFDVALKPVGGGQAVHRRGAVASIPVMLGASPLSGASGDPQGAVLSIKSSEILSLVGQEERAAVRAEEMQMLAYGIAHEIKNPLGGILGAAQWILRGEGPDEDRAEGVRLILREARRINDLVEKMLEMGKTPPPPRPFALLPLLREAEQLLLSEARAQGKEVRFDLRVDPSLPPVSGHPDTVYRALLNILKNAVEAIERTGTVGIEARMNVNYRFARGRGRKRSFLEVEITDNGKGMTEEELRKALLPFYTTKPKGTGLGLVMARQAVTRLGGKMEIRSSPGAGTAVLLSLPVDPGRKAAT